MKKDTNFSNNSQQGNIIIGLLIGAVLALIPSYYFYNKYQQVQKKLTNPQVAAKEEIKSTVDKVAKLMDLPKDEQPTIATVTDKSKLKDQPFFSRAVNGDKVLLYIKARKAILYRESESKIIEVAPINIEKTAANQATGAAKQAATAPAGTAKVSPTGVMKK